MTLRLLITKHDAGLLVGSRGETIKRLRDDGAQIRLFGEPSHLERVINISGSKDQMLKTLRKVIEDVMCYQNGNRIDVRMLINRMYVAEVERFVGMSGINQNVMIYSTTIPESNDNVIKFTYDTCRECIASINKVLEFMESGNLGKTNTRPYIKYVTNVCNYGGYACDYRDYTIDPTIQHA